MKISAQEEYGLRCLLRLAARGPWGSATLAELSELEGLSLANAAKLMRLLRRHGFVTSTRGQAGGYTLARPAEAISVGEVLAALGGRLFEPSFCERHSGVERQCARMSDCSIRVVWRILQGAVDRVLDPLSLGDLVCSEAHMGIQAARRSVDTRGGGQRRSSGGGA